MTEIRHVHASGRFDQRAGDFHAALARYRHAASVVTVTEVDAYDRSRLLNHDNWASAYGDKGPRDDCGITWDTRVWDWCAFGGTVIVSPDRYLNERGNRAGKTAAAFAVLYHKAADRLVVWGSLHTPHGMQDELRRDKVRTDVGRAYVSITRGYRHQALWLAKKHGADAMVLSGDWNLNVRAAWVRAWFAAYRRGAGLSLNWRRPYPISGTHGAELIDATLYKGLTLAAPSSLLERDPTDDHRAYLNVFDLKEKP